MGVDLVGHGEESFHGALWRDCLDLAVAFGWQPAGTIRPVDYEGEWNGSYYTNDYQEVTDEDAGALAAALHRAVTAAKTGQNRTTEQAKAWEDLNFDAVRRLADFAEPGHFAIW